MRNHVNRILALILALLLALPVMTLAEDDAENILLSGQETAAEEQDALELEMDLAQGEDSLELEDQGLELNLTMDDSIELSEDLLELDVSGEAGEESPEANELADNAGETVSVRYIDAKGRDKGPVTCNKL